MATVEAKTRQGIRTGAEAARTIATDTYRFDRSLILLLFFATFNVPGVVGGHATVWYALLVIPVTAIVLVRAPRRSAIIRRPVLSDVVVLILMIGGLAGTTYGVLFLGTTATLRPTFVPMFIALLYLATLDQPSEQEADALVRGLIWVGLAYLLINLAVIVGIAPGPGLDGDHPFRNSQLFYVAMAAVGAVATRRRGMTVLVASLITYMVLTYPSGTTVVVALVTVVTWFITQPRASAARPYLIAIVVVILVSMSLLRFAATVDLTQQYFTSVGKQDNDSTRLAAWSAGMDRFWQSPIVGSVFAGNTYAQVILVPGQQVDQVQFHNDFVLFLAEGGVLGIGLLLVWIVLTEVTIIRRHRMFSDAGWSSHARLLRTLLVGWNAFFVAAAFNPQFPAVTASAAIFAVYGLMMSLGTPRIGVTARE
jgi:hypothetical protein